MILEGSTNGAAFEIYVEQLLAPSLQVGQLVVMDNLRAHKGELRRAGARTREALEEAICQALLTVTAQDAHGWFRHCGYVPVEASKP